MRVIEQHFGGWEADTIFNAGQQPLDHDRFQTVGQRRADEGMFFTREELQDARKRLLGVVAVDRSHHQMARLRRLNCCQHRFFVTQLANHDAVWILPDYETQRSSEIDYVDTNFTLRNDALLWFECVFDRVFDRDHVHRAMGVDVLEHGRQCRALAAARHPAYQDQSLHAMHDGLFVDLGQMQFFEIGNAALYATQRGVHFSFGTKSVDTEAIAAQRLEPRNRLHLFPRTARACRAA